MHVKSGVIQEFSSLDEWRHRTLSDVEADLAYLEIDRTAILNALSEYLSNSAIRTREIDWLFLNLLTYAEYVATVSEVRKKLQGIEAYVKALYPPKAEHITSIAVHASRPWQALTVLVVSAFALLIHPLLGIGVAAISIAWYIKRKNGIARIDSLLSSMMRTYASLNTVDLSWAHVSRALEDSRRDGAIWDASLFRLAESRQGEA